jgi:hypothetical protein
MMPDTFEERQAYIEKCELEMREAHAKEDRMRAQCEFLARLQSIRRALLPKPPQSDRSAE